jgi:hypothetical protein
VDINFRPIENELGRKLSMLEKINLAHLVVELELLWTASGKIPETGEAARVAAKLLLQDPEEDDSVQDDLPF